VLMTRQDSRRGVEGKPDGAARLPAEP